MALMEPVERILAIMRKEFIPIRRDPRTLAIVLILPIFQLVMFGYAVTSDVRHLPMAVLDHDRTPASRALAEAYRTSLYFDLDFYVQNDRELARLIDSANYMIPALVGLILQTMTALLTAVAIAREQGTLEGLIITPIRAAELMIGKIVPYVMVAFTAMIEILLVGTLWFKVPINGSVLLLVALAGLFLLSALGIGLLVSTIAIARTQQEAMMLAFFTILPSVFLSGFMFLIAAMPAPLQWASKLIPLTYFLIIDRGIVLKGNSMGILYPQALALAAFGTVILTLAVARFRKRLE